MRIAFSVAILCLFYLLVSGEYVLPEPEDVAKYYDCWTYVNCVLGEPGFKKFENCISVLPEKEFEDSIKYVNRNFFKYKSQTVEQMFEEYCTYKEEKRKKVFVKTWGGGLYFRKHICSMPDKQDECARLHQSFGCIFHYLDELSEQNKCTISY
ncbi:uncharacterized protein LOC129969516 [Argiope bruennichi]|uniref:uncharacterized protein LOC129969516 n=1 Tax=Argiope bruennichi TaxID=94029 RepID=UPI0024951948|nr:uncharacterized protein LOC129969516 [Argiope bruennichi]